MSMILNALPDFTSQLRSLQNALQEKSARVAELETELRRERSKTRSTEAGVEQLRATLSPLYQGLQLVFGQIDAMGVGETPVSDSKRAAWDSWKQKLGGLTAKAIDAMMLHGPMNRNQLRIQLHCANASVSNIITALNKAGLINKADGKYSLKEI